MLLAVCGTFAAIRFFAYGFSADFGAGFLVGALAFGGLATWAMNIEMNKRLELERSSIRQHATRPD